MKIQRIDHISIVVNDLPAAREFFLDFGLELIWEGDMAGALLDELLGLQSVKTAVAMMRAPTGGASVELVKYYQPSDESEIRQYPAHALGMRHIAFAVEDLEALVAKLKKRGTETFSEIQNYEDIYKLVYVRGPEGVILELAEKLG